MNVMSPAQCRVARVWLGWTQVALALAANVNRCSINDFEQSRRAPQQKMIDAVQRTLEHHGMVFIFDADDEPCGVERPVDDDRADDPGLYIKLARAWLDCNQQELADAARVSLSTLRDFEKGRRVPRAENLHAIQAVLIRRGVEFMFDAEGRPWQLMTQRQYEMAA